MTLNISFNIVGRGESVFFIHGIGSRKYSWNRVIEELQSEYQCVSYNLRGHGEIEIDENSFLLLDLVQDLEKLRLHLNIDKIHIVGHSLGGMIGPAYTKKYQDKVLSLSLLSTAAFRNINDQRKIMNIINQIESEGLNVVLPNLINRWFTDDFIKNNQEIINVRIKQVKDTPIKIFLNVFRLYAQTEIGSWLHEIKIPCLVMTGENDIGCNPDFNKKIADAIPNSKLIILKDLKHAITLEASKLVGKNIKLFLNNL